MGDEVLAHTEDELIARAIALSLEAQGASGKSEGVSRIADGGGTASKLTQRPEPVGSNPLTERPRALSPQGRPLRYDTSQSNDSALAEPEDSSFMGYQREMSQLSTGSPTNTQRSSPDLGIAAESDIDPLSGTLGSSQRRGGNGKNSRDSPSSSPEADQGGVVHRTENITLDGRIAPGGSGGTRHGTDIHTRRNPIGESYQLPFARLSSLHEGGGASAKVWSPNKDALELIIGMGISENAAKRALYHTGNDNAELAVGWVFENISIPELHEPFEPPVIMLEGNQGASPLGGGAVYLSFDEFAQSKSDSFKMIFVVNSDLKMGVGKVAAQVGHAVLGLYHFLESEHENRTGLAEWERNGAKKIVLRGVDAAQLLDLKRKASESTLACLVVQDAGRTQVEPGSLTVLGIFGRCKHIDALTGHLKLL